MQTEQFNVRPAEYSAWHRMRSTARYVGLDDAKLLSMIDVDAALYVEYDQERKRPLMLVETALDVGQNQKPATVLAELARMAGISAYVVLYALSDEQNPADDTCKDITGFRVKRIFPESDKGWVDFTPGQWSEFLLKARRIESSNAHSDWIAEYDAASGL